MPKTRRELEVACNGTLKMLLSVMEDLASAPPAEACEPVKFDQQRRQVIRRVWTLFKECIVYDPRSSDGD